MTEDYLVVMQNLKSSSEKPGKIHSSVSKLQANLRNRSWIFTIKFHC